MLIRWRGPTVARRIVAGHVWEAANGYVCEVADAALARALIEDGSGLFVAEEAAWASLGEEETRAATDGEGGAVAPTGTESEEDDA